MHDAPSSRTRRRTARRQTRGATEVASGGAVAVRSVTADLRAERVAAVIVRLCQSRGWIGVCDESGLFTDQGRRAVVRAPRILLGALGVEGSDIPQHPPVGASP
jgi:hypothetical protein